MKKIITSIILTVSCILNLAAQTPIIHTYSNNNGPDKNPMKGWNSGWWDNFDEATVGFQYIKWNEFEPTDGDFNFNYVEDVLNRPGSAGKHLIIRLYADWFGNNQMSDACPQWLYTDYNVERLQAPNNGKYITNYNHTSYISQAIEALEALANQYNDDPRIYTIQLGVLGYWGEWHTFSYNDPDFEIENETKNQILETCKTIFSNKKVMGRQPWDEPLTSTGNIGFHNDFFVPNNGHSDEFDDSISLNSQWLEGPIGGEAPPIDENEIETYMTALYDSPVGMNMITKGHYSTMKLGNDLRPCEDDPTGIQCQSFMEIHRKMGYNYQITSALFPETLQQSDNLSIEVNIQNIGVAPMYYNWNIQFALLDETNLPVKQFDSNFDVRTILADGSVHTVSLTTTLQGIDTENYSLAMRLIQPEADTEKTNPWGLDARNTYIQFSNDLPIVNGTWNTNNRLIGGWAILGDISVEESIGAIPNVLIYHETNGFRHGSINDGITLITNLGTANGMWNATETQDSSNFNATTLANYDLVIWCNTSGNDLLTLAEQEAFENWISEGGAFMGIHAATDTYRDGSWPFYNELVGGIVQNGPNHTAANHNNNMDILEKHPAVDHLGTTWNKTEEYYYWEQGGGQLSLDNTNILFVESTGDNSYDVPRPMAWYKTSITVNNVTTPVRAFYTALGHSGSNYSNNIDFQQHIEGAIIWALPAKVTTYTAAGWDNNAPTADMLAVIEASYSTGTDGNIVARDIQINSGATVTVTPDSYIEIRENITVNGSLLIEHQGSLVQTSKNGTVTNNGSIKVNVTTPVLKPRDFMILGNPLTEAIPQGQDNPIFRKLNLTTTNFRPHPDVQSAFPGGTNFIDEDFNDWSNHTGNFNPGEGYYVWPQPSINEGNEQYNIMYQGGTLNNGDITYALDFNTTGTGTGTPEMNKNASPSIIANPYPSAISAEKFIAMNDAIDEIYFWEHNTTPNNTFPGANSVNFNMADISIFNDTGFNPASTGSVTSSGTGDFSIATGQGFGVKNNGAMTGTGQNIMFLNNMRLLDGNTTLRSSEDKNNIWLTIHNEEFDLGSTTLIGFTEEATPLHDTGYDSKRIGVPVSIYSHLIDGTAALGIQGREAFDIHTEIELGFSTQIAKDNAVYHISVKDIIGIDLDAVTVYLKDNQMDILTNISETPYSFISAAGTYNNRFTLQFLEEEILSSSEISAANILLFPNPTSDVFTIISPSSRITSAIITDALGRIIRTISFTETTYKIDISALKSALYFVTIKTKDGSIIKRVIKK